MHTIIALIYDMEMKERKHFLKRKSKAEAAKQAEDQGLKKYFTFLKKSLCKIK